MPRKKQILSDEDKVLALVGLLHLVEVQYVPEQQGFVMQIRRGEKNTQRPSSNLRVLLQAEKIGKALELPLRAQTDRTNGGLRLFAPISRFDKNYELFVRAVTKFWRER